MPERDAQRCNKIETDSGPFYVTWKKKGTKLVLVLTQKKINDHMSVRERKFSCDGMNFCRNAPLI